MHHSTSTSAICSFFPIINISQCSSPIATAAHEKGYLLIPNNLIPDVWVALGLSMLWDERMCWGACCKGHNRHATLKFEKYIHVHWKVHQKCHMHFPSHTFRCIPNSRRSGKQACDGSFSTWIFSIVENYICVFVLCQISCALSFELHWIVPIDGPNN